MPLCHIQHSSRPPTWAEGIPRPKWSGRPSKDHTGTRLSLFFFCSCTGAPNTREIYVQTAANLGCFSHFSPEFQKISSELWLTENRVPQNVLERHSGSRDPSQSGRGTQNAKKPLNGFQGCHENALNGSCEMSPHLMCLG